jgi:hypothetical protein
MSNSADGKFFSNISATTAAFKLEGGQYTATVSATWNAGSVTLQTLSADGSTWLTAMTAFSANGIASAVLPAGQYRFAITSATAVYATIAAS